MSGVERLAPAALVGPRIPIAGLQRASLWLLVCASGVVVVEPSPYEFMFAVTAGLFALTGLKFDRRLAPLLVGLLLFNLGGAIALVPFLNERPASVMFVVISVYMMFTSLFFAALMAENTAARLDIVLSGYVAAAWGASIAGILGYFDVADLGEKFALYNRASGTFKDPNVLGPFLVLPIVSLMQALFLGRTGLLRTVVLMSVPLFAVFLSFSRGAWVLLAAAVALMLALHFMTGTSGRERARVVAIFACGVAAVVAMLVAALSFESISKVFEIRASLDQDYDVGTMGRFGRHLRSIPLLLDRPNGFGPLHFRYYFIEDAHNVYVNAFASYGWLGGLSYVTLIATTVVAGWRTVFVRTPYQTYAIAVWSTLFLTILQGVQIDTDHWRHFYLMLGLTWGLAAVTAGARGAREAPGLSGSARRATSAGTRRADPSITFPGDRQHQRDPERLAVLADEENARGTVPPFARGFVKDNSQEVRHGHVRLERSPAFGLAQAVRGEGFEAHRTDRTPKAVADLIVHQPSPHRAGIGPVHEGIEGREIVPDKGVPHGLDELIGRCRQAGRLRRRAARKPQPRDHEARQESQHGTRV